MMLMLMLSFSHATIAGEFDDVFAAAQKGGFATALRLLTPLAEQGNAEAQLKLGAIYAYSISHQNYKSAVKWFTLAAEQGNARGQLNLAKMYEKGTGIEQDYRVAVKLYTLSAEQGDTESHRNLGFMYEEGKGVEQDYVKAHMWLNIAAIDGNSRTTGYRDIIAEKMTPAQIEKAQEAASRCIKQNFKNCD